MARIPIVHDDTPELTPEQHTIIDGARHTRGRVLIICRAMAKRGEAALSPDHAELA